MTQPAPRDARWVPHVRVAWGGSLGTPGVEIWSNSLRFRPIDNVLGGGQVPTHEELQDTATAFVPILSGWMTDQASKIGIAAFFEYVKVNWVGADGLQLDTNTVRADASPKVGGTFNEIRMPWHNTYALTLRTAKGRGRAHAGRIFPPLVSPILDAFSPYISVADATGMATSFARIIYALNAALEANTDNGTAGYEAVVISPGSVDKGTQAIAEPITGVVCDRVGDVMHSRNRAVARAEGALVAPGP